VKRVIIESPLGGNLVRNRRYALWCARHCYSLGEAAYASHLLYPQFLDDQIPEEREFGILAGFEWATGLDCVFYTDLGWSSGMLRAKDAMSPNALHEVRRLPPELLAEFEAGEYPPSTRGFAGATECSFCGKASEEVEYLVAKEGKEPGRPSICNECVWTAAKHMVAAGWTTPVLSVKVGPDNAALVTMTEPVK